MAQATITSHDALLEMLRVRGPMDVTEIARRLEITPTAVRQRLARMLSRGLVARESVRAGRGRPRHRYQLTQKGLRLTGSNFADLALALWREVRQIDDDALRQRLLSRVVKALAADYAPHIEGETTAERMESLTWLLRQRRVPFEVEDGCGMPVLTARACPYPELAEEDRTICTFEKMLFSELLQQEIELCECRLDRGSSCRFKPK